MLIFVCKRGVDNLLYFIKKFKEINFINNIIFYIDRVLFFIIYLIFNLCDVVFF